MPGSTETFLWGSPLQSSLIFPPLSQMQKGRDMKNNEVSKLSCPNCHSTNVIPIAYGYPEPKLLEDSSQGKVALGGCNVDEDSPEWECQACKESF